MIFLTLNSHNDRRGMGYGGGWEIALRIVTEFVILSLRFRSVLIRSTESVFLGAEDGFATAKRRERERRDRNVRNGQSIASLSETLLNRQKQIHLRYSSEFSLFQSLAFSRE